MAHGPSEQAASSRRRVGRVVQVSSRYPPYVGGLENVVACLAQGLAAEGLDVEVDTTDDGARDAPHRETRGGVSVHRHHSFQLANAPVAPGILLSLLLSLWRRGRGSVVHVHYPQAGVAECARLACWLTGARLVVHFHLDVDASGPAGRLLPLYRRLILGPILRSADLVLALSEDMATQIGARYRLSPARVRVLPNAAVEVDAPVAGDVVNDRRLVGIGADDAGPVRLLLVARLDRQKNVARFLHALQLTTAPYEAVIVGDGDDRSALERLVCELGLTHVRFTGQVTQVEVADWMRWADVLVSSSDQEGMPLVMLEAMALGLPVLSTDVPGSHELLDSRGLLVDTDPAGLARGIERLAGDDALRRELGAAGLSYAATHSWSAACRRLIDEYESIRR